MRLWESMRQDLRIELPPQSCSGINFLAELLYVKVTA